MSELEQLKREISNLRGEISALRWEVAALRQQGPHYYPQPGGPYTPRWPDIYWCKNNTTGGCAIG